MDLSTFRQTGLSYKRKASAAFIQITPNQDMTFILGLIVSADGYIQYCICTVYSRHPFKVVFHGCMNNNSIMMLIDEH